MKKSEAINLAKAKLPDRRFQHSCRVADTAVQMAKIFGANEKKCFLAGMLHDYAKYDDLKGMQKIVKKFHLAPEYLQFKSEILHGPIAAHIMKTEHGVTDADVLYAMENHTSGRSNMTLVEKIVFVADYIEPRREIPGVKGIRKVVFGEKNLDKAVFLITKANLLHLISKDRMIFSKTFECYNYYSNIKE
ncbi:bis(5'-nucleosyl)-tetraphosphatase (symmetrical) YqeK [Phocicoccus pinnipedialis]|uniref:bis(5'-nucleosyl)-tetraphosphatase (symmetrical) n=1 Tax=Phocicoccus pinnipedialis TaxID=110845 RepID=A0A6V7REF3_9BACL|nr:bis(5'-nucleosyl)-tetraphosphatase (symmetrical) YqeK [Jeotgalicoccus pinnipedialis]MBP1939240.1 putative HD superfamily hydrolase involved in NAD metabolism [Jeotgalicoccus pinnipedialis]CAD2076174.1 putative nicotinate-nucleotide adenylyltransferase [Jeotgalicoccus pinnipedialis]